MSEYRRRRSAPVATTTPCGATPGWAGKRRRLTVGTRMGRSREIREQLVVVGSASPGTPDTRALAYDPSITTDPGCISMSSHRSAAAYVAPLWFSCGFSSVRRWFSFKQKKLSSMRTSGFLRRSMFHVGDSAISHKSSQIWPQQNVTGDRKAQAVPGGCVAGTTSRRS